MIRLLCSILTYLATRPLASLFALASRLIFALPLSALAALSIGSSTVDGQSAVAVPPGGTITGSVTATTDSANFWRSTGWSIQTTAPSSYTCVDTPNHTNANETATENLTLTAPTTAGTYNAYFVVASNDGGSCSGQTAKQTLANSVVVTAPTLGNVSSSGSAVLGDIVTFRITATNPLPIPMDNMVVTDTLGSGTTYLTYVATAGTASVAGQVVTWTIPIIPPNSSVQLTVAVKLTQSGTLTNTASAPGATSATASVLVLAKAATHFRMDETAGSWNGTAGEVLDSGGTGLQGQLYATVATTTNAVTPTPSIVSQNTSVVGSFCNAGNFDGNAIVRVASNPVLQYSTKLSASAWIYPTAAPSRDLYSILSNDLNYEFHLNPSRKLNWWWESAQMTSATSIPLNQWTHVAITMDANAGRQYIYINGVRDTSTQTWKGTLKANKCDFYIGGDGGIAGDGSCVLNNARNFRGKIDEVKLYNFELSQAEVQADMMLGRQCSGDFDHIRIEHDGSASICTPKTVTVKACMDANCKTLYPGAVTVALSPSGWVDGNSFTFTGGITTRQLSIDTASTVTLGSGSASPTPSNATRCYIGGTQNCSMTFASASCAFDAAETGGGPQSRIYTKLADTEFKLDILALRSRTAINTGYTGTATVDLVDSSATNCPSGSGLTTGQSVVFTGSDQGRKNVSFNYANAARNVRVRIKIASSAPACSSDNFAIRPKQFAVSSSGTDSMTNTGLTGTPKAKAGTAFPLTAESGVGAGYDGTPAIDSTKINDHNGTAIASGTFSGTFNAATGASATGSAFKYLDVGNIQFATDAVTDSSFSTVDQTTDCIAGSTSNNLSGGKYGCNVGSAASDKFGRWYPSHYSFAGTLTPGCTTGAFTYMGQDALAVALTLKAHATTGAAASSDDPVTSRYTSGYTNLASVTFTGDNAGASVAVTRLISPTFPNTTSWTSGVFSIEDTYAFSRLASPDGPYDAFKLVPRLSDPDGSSLIGTSPATNATSVRYGRLQIGNAYGPELLDLGIPYEAQYWKGSYYTTNLLDSCTSFNVSSIMMSNFTQNLSACETQLSPTGTQTLTKGKLALKLTKPGVDAAGGPNRGSVLLTQNIGNSASGSTCVSSASSPATAANLSWFGNNPTGQATFGIYRAPYIYFREAY